MGKVVHGFAALCAAACLGLMVSVAAAEADAPGGKNALLVRFAPEVDVRTRARTRGREGAVSNRAFRLVPGLELWSLPETASRQAVIARLRGRPGVLYAEPDERVDLLRTDDTYYSLLYAIENTGQAVASVNGVPGADMNVATALTRHTAGAEQLVAVIDSGVDYDHPDLAANMWTNAGEIPGNGFDDDGNGYVDDVHGYDFFEGDGDPRDVDGHGTHVAGTICAVGDNGIGIVGVSRNCRIMALRFIGPNGGYTSGAIAALDYAVAMGAKLSNNSWGGGGFSQALEDAIQRAAAADHIFVAAAGNDASDNDRLPQYPAGYALGNVVAVAATDNRDGLADFTNYGAATVDLGAPGVAIASTYVDGGYAYLDGTSMAAPNVTGVLALMREAFPEWDHTRIIERLLGTVRPVASLAGRTVSGGVPDAVAALESLPSVPPAPPSGLLAAPSGPGAVELVWTDNSDTEAGFTVERGLADATRFEIVSEVEANSTRYVDTGLLAATEYRYRVSAFNAAGVSEATAEVTVVTEDAANETLLRVESETTVAGSVEGGFAATFEADGVDQTLRERESGGNPRRRFSYLEHRWALTTPGGLLTIEIDAAAASSAEAEGFAFEASSGGRPFESLFTIAAGSAGAFSSTYLADPGTLVIRVVDTLRASGTRTLDRLAVDRILVRAPAGETGNLPPSAAASVRCDGLVCSFDGSGSVDVDGEIASFDWSFGDGETAAGETVSHGYGVAGRYLATLRIRDDAGADDSVDLEVLVEETSSVRLLVETFSEGGSWRAVVRTSDGSPLQGSFDAGDAGCTDDRCVAVNRKRVSETTFRSADGRSVSIPKP